MLKYLKYYIPAVTGILFIIFIMMGQNYPTYFFIGWSLFLFIGDYISVSYTHLTLPTIYSV